MKRGKCTSSFDLLIMTPEWGAWSLLLAAPCEPCGYHVWLMVLVCSTPSYPLSVSMCPSLFPVFPNHALPCVPASLSHSLRLKFFFLLLSLCCFLLFPNLISCLNSPFFLPLSSSLIPFLHQWTVSTDFPPPSASSCLSLHFILSCQHLSCICRNPSLVSSCYHLAIQQPQRQRHTSTFKKSKNSSEVMCFFNHISRHSVPEKHRVLLS